ncbi:MAG TPA: outer membrane protein assembly factor BamB [Methylothermaceae bacterium]|nr:outer membrane protein assembly factor BamB [Methylothermaceae bacterium]
MLGIRIAVLMVAVLLNGCQSMGAGFSNLVTGTIDLVTGGGEELEPPRELVSITPEIDIDILWDEDVGAGDGGHWLALTPVVGDDAVFAADASGRVVALKLADGRELFEIDTDLPISAGPGSGWEHLLLGTSEAQVVALSLDSGETRWTAEVSSEVLAPPVADRGIVVVHAADDAVFALAEDSGKPLWSYGKSVSRLTLRGVSTPKIVDTAVLIGFANGRMAALRLKDGKLFWERQLAIPEGVSEMERIVDIDSAPAVRQGMLYVTAYYGGVIAASLVDGEVIWRNTDIIANTTPAVTWRYVFVSDTEGDIWGLDVTTGRAYWKQDALHRRQVTAPVVFGDYLAVGDYKGYVHFLAQEDGRQVGRIRVSRSPIHTPPVVAGDRLIVYASDGDLAVLRIEPSSD